VIAFGYIGLYDDVVGVEMPAAPRAELGGVRTMVGLRVAVEYRRIWADAGAAKSKSTNAARIAFFMSCPLAPCGDPMAEHPIACTCVSSKYDKFKGMRAESVDTVSCHLGRYKRRGDHYLLSAPDSVGPVVLLRAENRIGIILQPLRI
jgi:hypothetical protein